MSMHGSNSFPHHQMLALISLIYKVNTKYLNYDKNSYKGPKQGGWVDGLIDA